MKIEIENNKDTLADMTKVINRLGRSKAELLAALEELASFEYEMLNGTEIGGDAGAMIRAYKKAIDQAKTALAKAREQ